MTALLIVVALAATPDAAQRRTPLTPQEKQVNAAIALKAGTSTYSFAGQATCEHLPKGSIYNTIAERWSVSHNDSGRSVSLNLWKPLSGGDNIINLYVSIGGKQYKVDTAQPGHPVGSATITFAPEGKGGKFTIAATSDSGAKITGTIQCDAFTVSEAVAG